MFIINLFTLYGWFFAQATLAVNEKELCKYFEPGNHVKVVSGTQEGATGMVVKVEQHVLIILSDTTKEHVSDSLSRYHEGNFVDFFIISPLVESVMQI